MEDWEVDGWPRVFDTPWPRVWRADRVLLIASVVVMLALGGLGLVALFSPGDRLLDASVAFVGLGIALPPLLIVTTRRGRTAGVDSCPDGPGMEFRRRALAGFARAWASTAVMGVLVAFVAAFFQGLGWLVAVVIAVLLIGMGLGWTILTIRRGLRPPVGAPRLRIAPEGVSLRGRLGTRSLVWDERPIPVPMRFGALHVYPRTYLDELAASRRARTRWWFRAHLVVAGGTFDADPAAIAAAIMFYGHFPERRWELESAVAVERVRRGDLPTAWPSRAAPSRV